MSERMTDERLTEIGQHWLDFAWPTTEQCEELLQALKAERESHIDVTEACLARERELQNLRKEVERLRGEVKEWICVDCNTVYPGPPTKGFDCVQCPKCKGPTAARSSSGLTAIWKARANTAESRLTRLLDALEKIYAEGVYQGTAYLGENIEALIKEARGNE